MHSRSDTFGGLKMRVSPEFDVVEPPEDSPSYDCPECEGRLLKKVSCFHLCDIMFMSTAVHVIHFTEMQCPGCSRVWLLVLLLDRGGRVRDSSLLLIPDMS